MPTYEYRCPKCGVQKELIQKISERVNPKCESPSCEGEVMETVLSSSPFILKGSNWAKDGYGK